MKYELLYSKKKRPNNSKEKLREELLSYIKEEAGKNHFPSRRELEKKFHLKLDSLFQGIDSLYKSAGLKYKLAPNQDLKSKKANLFLNLIIENLDKFDLKLITFRNVRERGIDIVCRKSNKKIGIELKAYNKNERVKKKDIFQARRFLKKEQLNEVFIFTTTDLIDKNISRGKIKIRPYSSLVKVLKNNKALKTFLFIREKSVNIEDSYKDRKRKKIIDYVEHQYKKYGRKPSYKEISSSLNLHIYTYFKSLFEVYKSLKIPPPLKNMGGLRAKNPDKESIELWKNEFKKYILNELEKGNKYPSGEQIGKHFRVSHIWNIVSMNDLYKELGLKPYLQRKKRFTFSPKP